MSKTRTPSTRKIRRRIDYRWLRSDGTPNISNRIHKAPGDMEIIAKKPVVSLTPHSPLIEAVEIMANNYRSIVIAQNNYLKGLLLASHIINYLGGGEYYNIVVGRHNYNIFSALEKEHVEELMEKNPVVAYTSERLPDVLEKMIIYGVGVVPVIEEDDRVYGIVTEHDLVGYLYGIVRVGVKVSEIMSTPVVTINRGATLKEAMEYMIKYGFRRLPVVDGEQVVGIVTAMDIIRYFNPKTLFKELVSEDIRDVLRKPVEEVMTSKILYTSPDTDLGNAVNKMIGENRSSILVVDENMRLLGIVTERDVLYALTVGE
jgi:CBS domain-containing protein